MIDTPEVRRAFDHIARAKKAAQAVEFIGDDLIGKQHSLDMVAFNQLNSGQVLDPQLAVQLFTQKWAIWSLSQRLLSALNGGEAASRIVAPMMTEEDYGPQDPR